MLGLFEDDDRPWTEQAWERLTAPPDEVNPVELGARAAAWAGFVLWSLYFLSLPVASPRISQSFMHLVNLPFHEAGHMILMPLGWGFLTSLGGSLGQLAFPLIVGGALLAKNRDAFGASLGLWWFAQSLMDLAPYIGDARALQMMLLGGQTGAEVEGHDWEAILTYLGLLKYDVMFARLAHLCGWALMVASLAWGGYMLLQQKRRLAP